MKLKRLYINNYKSLVDFELIEPNPFSVFVGPNGAGKSNIFEALEFLIFLKSIRGAINLFGGFEKIKHFKYQEKKVLLEFSIENYPEPFTFRINNDSLEFTESKNVITKQNNLSLENFEKYMEEVENESKIINPNYYFFFDTFSRIFVKNQDLVKIKTNGNQKLRIDAANLEKVLHRILQKEEIQEEFSDWVQTLIPGTDRVEVAKSDLSGDYFLRFFEKNMEQPIGKDLISDGTYNILALLTAVYQ